MAIEIRVPQVEDADALGRVHVRAWQAAYTGGLMPDEYLESLSVAERAAMWRSSLENPSRARGTRLVATIDNKVVGFALVGPAGGDPDAPVGELYAINVDPDHWGSGAGPALIDAAMEALRSSGFVSAVLWVHPENGRACSFYARRGWVADDVDRQQEVLGVEVPETRLSLALAA
jgi:ribosomal protein S18 acetylase RimI-like enzyme